MKFSDCMTDYLGYIRHERGLSDTTCIHYQSWLRHFVIWLRENGYADPDVEDVLTLPVLRRYQYHKTKEGVRPRTVHSAFFAIKGLGDFLVANGLLESNPARLLTLPKKDAAIRLIVTDEDVTALFKAAENQKTLRQVALYRAVLSVLAHGGLRRTEVCDLLVEDVKLSEKSILVRSGKGSKSRRVFVCQEAVHALREWLAVREPDTKHPFLFSLDRNRRMYHEGIAALIETLKATAGLRDNEAVKPHGLRHWCATNLLRNGANLRDVQAFLGHCDIKTTAVYLHSSEEQLRGLSEMTAMRPPAPASSSKPPAQPTSAHVRRITRR